MVQPVPRLDMLFYDARCPLCSREIGLLRRIADDALTFQDIHQYHPQKGQPESSALLQTLHLLDADGHWQRGVDAIIQAWSHTRYGWLLRALRWPSLAGVSDKLYAKWAQRRYRRIYDCQRCVG